jgi:uncharacterized membrane protein
VNKNTLYSKKETVVGGQFNMETTRNMESVQTLHSEGTMSGAGVKRVAAASGSRKVNVKFMTELALLIAIVILMALTPIGYIRTPILTLTLITIPVAVGAIILGPTGGAICGLAFGLTSFYTALTAPSAMMAAFMVVNPVYVAILCIVPRILDGWLCGLVFKGLRKVWKNNPASCYIAGVCCPAFNTVLFMSTLVLLFYNCDYVVMLRESLGVSNPFAFIIAVVGVQALIEAVCCGALSGIITQQLYRILKR